jgi:ketosteroid isomerase-like protein
MIERLDRMYELVWRERDLDAAFADMSEDFEWVMPGHPDGAVRRGAQGVRDFFCDWIDQWEDPESEWTLERTRPDTVLVLVTMRGRGKASGVPVEENFAQVWTFRDEEPIRMVLYADPDKARAAAKTGA